MAERIAIFGYGPVGRATAARLLAEGGEVIVAQRRAPPDLPREAAFAPCDALNGEAVVRTVRDCGQFVVAIGFRYSGVVWRDAWPRAIANFVAASKATGARMVLIDNLYMYGPRAAPLVETMPLADYGWKPAARAAATRVWMEAAAAGEARVAALRAPDFYGPGVGQSDSATPRSATSRRGSLRCSSAPPTSCTTTPTCRTSRARRRLCWRRRLGLWPSLARALRADAHDPRHPENRGRRAWGQASHQRHARLDAGRERDVLAVPAGIDRDALPVGPALSRRRKPFRRRLLVRPDAVRDRRARDRARLPRRLEGEALRASRGVYDFARDSAFSMA